MQSLLKINKTHPLTLPQQDIFYDQLLYPENPMYNIGAEIKIKGKIDVDVMRSAYKILIDQNDAFRSILLINGSKVEIKILANHNSELGYLDYSKSKNATKRSKRFIEKQFRNPFNVFDEELLHNFVLIKVKDNQFSLFSMYHHIITDGWGTSLMFQRLVRIYNELLSFEDSLSADTFSYIEFSNDDLNYQKSKDYESDRAYWLNKFNVLPDSLVPILKDRQPKSKQHSFFIERVEYNRLYDFSKEIGVSVFHCILGLLFAYFGRLYSKSDFAIGLPVLNRGKAIFKKTVGLFMGISPLRIGLDFEDTFQTLCVQIKNELRKDYRHQRFPIGKLIQELNCLNERDRLISLTLSYEKHDYSDAFKNTKTNVIPLSHESEQAPLAVYIREFDKEDDVKVDFDYNLSFYTEEFISKVSGHFLNLIKEVLESPSKKIKDLDFLSHKNKQLLLTEFNNSSFSNPTNETILDIINKQAERLPEKVAIRDIENGLTYDELKMKSNQIEKYLSSNFSDDDFAPVCVLMKRSIKLPLVLLGILKSGRPYIPLDPSFPARRLNYIMNHSKSKLLISEGTLELDLDYGNVKKIYFEDMFRLDLEIEDKKKSEITPDKSAYIIYTSGSTGNPKGVEITHRSLTNFLLSMKEKPGMGENDILYAVTTYSFDISILELFLPLIVGGTVFVSSHEILSDSKKLIAHLKKYSPSIIQATPSFYQILFHAGWNGDPNLKVLCGGDSLSKYLSDKLLDSTNELWNMYGPTETTIWSSIKQIITSNDYKSIGKPIRNTSFYILDKWLNMVPIGISGDIFIGGEGLAKGYYQDYGLTEQRFLINPFNESEHIYKTGDIGKWNSLGEIEFLGRKDNQVKVRGYRIELGEIEKKLLTECGFDESIVVAKKEDETNVFLVGYVKADINSFSADKIIEQLKSVLPDYMIPRVLSPMAEFPLTPNGKVDRKTLSKMEVVKSNGSQNDEITNFKGGTELKLKVFWEKILRTTVPNSHSDFFELGGHSINATELISTINEHFLIELQMRDVFESSTIYKQAALIKSSKNKRYKPIPKTKKRQSYPLAASQEGLWLICQNDRISTAYNIHGAFEVKGNLSLDVLYKSITSIISENEVLRTNFLEDNGSPRQLIRATEEIDFELPKFEFRNSNEVDKFISDKISTTFDLGSELLFRAYYLEAAGENPVLLFITHHLILDGGSLQIFIKILETRYRSIWENKTVVSTARPIQFKDYTIWSQKISNRTSSKQNIQYWINQFKEFENVKVFGIRKGSQSFKGGIVSFDINRSLYGSLKKTAADFKMTTFNILFSAIQVLIYKFDGIGDFCLGVPVSMKNHQDLKAVMGMFVNTLPIRCQIEDNETFMTHCERTTKLFNNARKRQNFSFYNFSKSLSSSENLFDVVVAYQHQEMDVNLSNGFEEIFLKPYTVDQQVSRFPLTFNFIETKNKINCSIEYDQGCFEALSITLISERLKKLLNEVLIKPNTFLKQLDVQLEIEKQLKTSSTTIEFNF